MSGWLCARLTDPLDHPPHQRDEVMRLTLYLQLPGLKTCHLEQGVGKRLEALGRPADLLQRVLLPLRQLWAVTARAMEEQGVDIPAQGGEGGLQCMGGEPEKRLLHLVGLRRER